MKDEKDLSSAFKGGGGPVPAFDVQIVSREDNTTVLKRGEFGKIAIRAPQAQIQIIANNSTINVNGYAVTDDIACMGEDGLLYLNTPHRVRVVVPFL